MNSKPPKIVGGPSVEGYNQRRSFNVSAVVEDANGDDNIRGCNLIILDEEGTIDNYDMRIERKYDGGKQALCNYNEISVDTNENWESGEVLRLNVTVLDNAGLLDSETVYYKLREGVVEEKSYETVSRDINSASRPFIMLILSIVILSIGIAVIVRYEVLKRKGRVVQE